jgi:hypothetical protein
MEHGTLYTQGKESARVLHLANLYDVRCQNFLSFDMRFTLQKSETRIRNLYIFLPF